MLFSASATSFATTTTASQSGTLHSQSEADTSTDQRASTRPCKQPRHHVILWNDEDHSYEYVIRMLKQLFRHSAERGFQIAREVDASGRAVVLSTTKEHAELKCDQIHAFGSDQLIARSTGSMSSSIEAEC